MEDQAVDLVIIGATGGIGHSLAESFAGSARIHGTWCHEEPASPVEGVEYHRLNLEDREGVATFCETLAPRLERPVIVYTSGVSLNGLTHKIADEAWDQTLAVNLTGAMLVSRGLLPRMREIGFGRIILLSSVLSRTMVPGSAPYSVTKAGLSALGRVIAVENAKKGITANTLALGYHNVGIIQTVPPQFLEEKVLPSIPVGHLGDPSNISNAVQFLIDSDYVTGATLDINGGIIGA